MKKASKKSKRGNKIKGAAAIIALLLMSLAIPRVWMHESARKKIYSDTNKIPFRRVAIVFGTSVLSDGTPSPLLYDRVAAAVKLYKAGKVKKLLMSGDNKTIYYDEPGTMKSTAMSLGVPENAIEMDLKGARTWDSCFRAKHKFSINKAVLVTQDFHLDRALYLAKKCGIDAIGFEAEPKQSKAMPIRPSIREIGACILALWDGATYDRHSDSLVRSKTNYPR